MPSLDDALDAVVSALRDRYGTFAPTTPPDDFEALARVLLAQSLASAKVEAVTTSLKESGLLDPEVLSRSDPADLLAALESGATGAHPKWLGPLRRLASWYVESGGAEALRDRSTESLRESLRGLRGLGPSAVDGLLMRGLNRETVPISRGTARVLVRHGWADVSQSYDEVRQTLEALDPSALPILSQGFDRLSRDFCKAAGPRCDACPLRPWLPPSGPIEPE